MCKPRVCIPLGWCNGRLELGSRPALGPLSAAVLKLVGPELFGGQATLSQGLPKIIRKHRHLYFQFYTSRKLVMK